MNTMSSAASNARDHEDTSSWNGVSAASIIEALSYVEDEIKAGRLAGYGRHVRKGIIAHNCRMSIKVIREIGLTKDTREFAVRVLYAVNGRVQRDLSSYLVALVNPDLDKRNGRGGETSEKLPIS